MAWQCFIRSTSGNSVVHVCFIDYTVALEKELAEVKRTNRQLKITMEESLTTAATSRAEASAQAEAVRHCSHDMSRLRAQLDESRHTIGKHNRWGLTAGDRSINLQGNFPANGNFRQNR